MTDVMDRLDEALLDATRPQDSTDETGSIRSLDEAAWAARKVADAYRQVGSVDAWKERQIAAIEAAADAEKCEPERTIDFMEGALGLYLRGLLRDGRKTKTLTFPSGKVTLRARSPRLEIEDEKVALDWLTANAPEYVRVKESVDKSQLRKALANEGSTVVLTDTGETVSWVRFEPQADSVTFTATEEE